MPVTSARRADSAGIDSGIARSNRSEFFVSSFRLGVFAGASPSKASTWLGADERQHDHDRAAPAVVAQLRRGRRRGGERPEHAGAGGRRAAASQQAPAA